MPKYFTLRVVLCNDENFLFKNLTEEQEKEARQKIWVEGLRRKKTHNTYELINPFTIKSAHMIEQEGWIED